MQILVSVGNIKSLFTNVYRSIMVTMWTLLYDLYKDAVYFLSHHAVFNGNNETTKLRTVFYSSMKTNKKSL